MIFHIHKDIKIAQNAINAIKEAFGQQKRFTVKLESRRRTIPQNAYYHGVVLATIAAETGHTPDDLHEYFKKKYLCAEVKQVFDKQLVKARSTTSLNTAEFNDYIEQIRAEMAHFGIVIPDPQEGRP